MAVTNLHYSKKFLINVWSKFWEQEIKSNFKQRTKLKKKLILHFVCQIGCIWIEEKEELILSQQHFEVCTPLRTLLWAQLTINLERFEAHVLYLSVVPVALSFFKKSQAGILYVCPALKWKVLCWSKLSPWDSWHVWTWLEMKSVKIRWYRWIACMLFESKNFI